jgi:hypothetical protein
MPNTAEEIASRFKKFIDAVEKKAATPRPEIRNRMHAKNPTKTRESVLMEECLKQLPPEDLVKLGRIIERMTEELQKVKG